ncbi:MAG: hypothetical protein EPO08_20715 [Rhodospirillaceae bacterium]|nr:MAG: hypothetical protein EPO08_20715 [Rhodospirillaceae bacterium]
MANIKTAYGTNGQAITCTLASLTNSSVRAGTAIDNTSNLYQDALVQIKVKTGGSGASAQGVVNIYAYATADGGTTYPEANGGSDGGVTLVVPTNLRLIGTLNAVANSITYSSEPMSVALAFGGVLPSNWGIVIENKTGTTLDSTESNHLKVYQGVYQTVA